MKLSIFTTITNPQMRGDNYTDALNCYRELADEVVIVNGGKQITEHLGTKVINRKWDTEFDWPFIGKQFQRGYEVCSGDWVIHADLDFIFHEKDFDKIRQACITNPNAPALSFWKYQFILPDRYNLKSRLVLAVNRKKYGRRIRFNSGGDLCQPSIDGNHIYPAYVPEAHVAFYNYDKLTKTKGQIMNDQGRMERAYHRHFGNYQLSKDGSDKEAYKGWLRMQQARINKPSSHIRLEKHPKFVQDTIRNLTPDQFGYNGFGLVEKTDYHA